MSDNKKLIASHAEENNELQLWEHTVGGKSEYEMIINGVFIMATYNSLSSELLVRYALKALNTANNRILIGGLGFGFSVKEACRNEKNLSGIYVVETNPVVIEWNKTHLYDLNGKYLFNEKVHLVQDDFILYVKNTNLSFDAICMDIDNGPMLLISQENSAAYTGSFFQRIREILNVNGIFSVWSGNEDRQLYADMANVFGCCSVEEVTEIHFGKEVLYYLYTAQRTK